MRSSPVGFQILPLQRQDTIHNTAINPAIPNTNDLSGIFIGFSHADEKTTDKFQSQDTQAEIDAEKMSAAFRAVSRELSCRVNRVWPDKNRAAWRCLHGLLVILGNSNDLASSLSSLAGGPSHCRVRSCKFPTSLFRSGHPVGLHLIEVDDQQGGAGAGLFAGVEHPGFADAIDP